MMKDCKTLERKLRNELRYNPVRIRREDDKDHDSVKISVIEPGVDFMDMIKERKFVSANEMRSELRSEEGYLFANYGVSHILTLGYQGNNYLILENQKSRRRNILKHVSGYTEDNLSRDPLNVAKKELSEEFLPFTEDGKLLRLIGMMRDYPRPFEDHFKYCGEEERLDIDDDAKFKISADVVSLFIDGSSMNFSPRITYHSPTNNAQILYEGHLEIPRKLKLDRIWHTRDIVDGDYLNTVISYKGIVLARLKRMKLTGELYELEGGQLREINTEGLKLSDAFARQENGIVVESEIGFLEYVDKK